MNYRLSPTKEGSNYIFFDPQGFLAAVGGASVSANQPEAGDTQLASINAPGFPLSITSNQIEVGDTQAAVIGDPIITPEEGDTVLSLIDNIGISVLSAIDSTGAGVTTIISDSGGVNAIISRFGVSVTTIIDDDGEGVEAEI